MSKNKDRSKGFKEKNNTKSNSFKKSRVNSSDLEIKALTYIQRQEYDRAIDVYQRLINQNTKNLFNLTNNCIIALFFTQPSERRQRNY